MRPFLAVFVVASAILLATLLQPSSSCKIMLDSPLQNYSPDVRVFVSELGPGSLTKVSMSLADGRASAAQFVAVAGSVDTMVSQPVSGAYHGYADPRGLLYALPAYSWLGRLCPDDKAFKAFPSTLPAHSRQDCG
jgi:hypothetical protein